MPAQVYITRGETFEGVDPVIVQQINTADGTQLLQADVTGSTVSFTVYYLDGGAPTTSVATGTVTVSSSVFDTLQTDGYWDGLDDTGYNFRHTMPAANLANGAGRYRIDYLAVTTSFNTIVWRAEVDVVEVY